MVKRSKFGDSQLNGELKTQKNHQVRANTIIFSVYSKQTMNVKYLIELTELAKHFCNLHPDLVFSMSNACFTNK